MTDAFYAALLEDSIEDLYEHAPCGYLSTTPDGTIVKVNQTFLDWTGYGSDIVGEKRFAELLTAGGRIYHETHVAPMLRMQGRVREIAVELLGADRTRLPVLVNAVVRLDEHGEPVVVRIAVFDARERRAYEQELLDARRRAEVSEHRARELAETLQASLIPPEPPVVPGLDLAGAYRPAGTGDEVGGDFYDVFDVGDDCWVITLGDVCGKGAGAAAVTALARYTMRASAMRDSSPAAVLRTLNEAIMRQHPGHFCTAVCLQVCVRPDESPKVRMSVGGHPLPLRVQQDGTSELFGRPGTLLGAFWDVELHEVGLDLGPGESLLLYSDGVTEARDASRSFLDDAGLRDLLLPLAGGSADEIADGIARAVVERQDGLPRDDVALVVVRAPRERG